MDKEQIIAYLMDVKGMSKEEAEEFYAAATDEEKDALAAEMKAWAAKEDDDGEELSGDDDKDKKELSEEEKKEQDRLQSEDDEKKKAKEDEDKDQKDKKLSAAKTKLTKLSADFRSAATNARLAAAKGRILTRLSKLRSDARITPAEVKKLEITKLAAQSAETIEEVLKTYESREPVIFVGQLGSVKAEEASKIQAQSRLSRLEAETRANMPLLARADKAKRLALGYDENTVAEGRIAHEIQSPDAPDMASFKAQYDDICTMIDQGNAEGAKQALLALLSDLARGASSAEYSESNALETGKELSALAESVQKMQTQFDDLHKLAGTLVG